MDLLDGAKIFLLHGPCFDQDRRSIQPGFCALVVAYGYVPTIFKKGHVELSLELNACSLRVSDQIRKISLRGKPPFHAAVLEKSNSSNSNWVKVVTVIK